MYKVIERFHDLQDSKKTKSGVVYHEYNVGDTFPRAGKEVSEERINELAGSENRRGTPLIELVDDEAEKGNKDAASAKASTVKKTTAKKTAAKSASK